MRPTPDLFGKNRRVERNLVPIGQCVTAFQVDCLALRAAFQLFYGNFGGQAKRVR